jgi:hypothetical protein
VPLLPLGKSLLGTSGVSDGNVIHLNPWRDFNDATPTADIIEIDPDPEQIGIFLGVVFGHCEGFIPVRGFIDKGQGADGKPHNIWIGTSADARDKLITFAAWAAREGVAAYVIPGTVAEPGQARATEVRQMQAVVVDLDAGDVGLKLGHLVRHLGEPTLIVESGGRTAEGIDKIHAWWRLTEPAEGEDLARLSRLRGDIAAKVGGDTHFRSAHQPIRIAGSIHHKGGFRRLVAIRQHLPQIEHDLTGFAEAVAEMPPLPGVGTLTGSAPAEKPGIDAVLTTSVREGGEDAWTRFQGASAAIGHYVRLVHDGRMTGDEGWAAICQYNTAMLRPAWPLERLKAEADRIWRLHEERHGPPLVRVAAPPVTELPAHTLGALLDDESPMPEDLIAPRVLTPGGMLVLGGAPKVGKSDFLISLLVHAAAGESFLRFAPPRPLRVFYLQAEIQYHYLRERLQQLRLDPAAVARARDTLVVTPKLRMLLDERGAALAAAAIRAAFPDAPPDILCIDPIRNLFDGGPGGESENDNAAMLFFLQSRVEALRDQVAPEAGIILAHHTKKLSKQQVKDDPFLALSGASALRGFYTSGMILFRPDEEDTARELHIELRNGPGLEPMRVDKNGGSWVELGRKGERITRRDDGAKRDAERVRKGDVILSLLYEEALEGRLYTSTQFAEKFESKSGLGGQTTIRERISVLATKGHIKFVKDGACFGLPYCRSKFGYLVVDGMQFGPGKETVDPETGEIITACTPVLPSHFKEPTTGNPAAVENPAVWVYPPGEGAD